MSDRILVIEDDELDQKFVRRAFEAWDASVEIAVANNGAEALERLEREAPPSVILTDIRMPRMDGKTFLARLRDDPRFQRIPTIVLSTSSAASEIRECYDRRANAYVVKPDTVDGYRRVAQRIGDFWLREAKPAN